MSATHLIKLLRWEKEERDIQVEYTFSLDELSKIVPNIPLSSSKDEIEKYISDYFVENHLGDKCEYSDDVEVVDFGESNIVKYYEDGNTIGNMVEVIYSRLV